MDNDYKFFDPKVCIEITLPAIPRIGECVYLSEQQLRELGEKASQKEVVHKYRIQGDEVGFDDCITVAQVGYFADEKTIHLSLKD